MWYAYPIFNAITRSRGAYLYGKELDRGISICSKFSACGRPPSLIQIVVGLQHDEEGGGDVLGPLEGFGNLNRFGLAAQLAAVRPAIQ